MKTRIVKVRRDGGNNQEKDQALLGCWSSATTTSTTGVTTTSISNLTKWEVPSPENATEDENTVLAPLREAAALLRNSDIPVAFPTETVYGLGADATRSGAVKGIYAAKGRPSDNPLIVHVCDLEMLRSFLRPSSSAEGTRTVANGQNGQNGQNGVPSTDEEDPIPQIYHPLIQRFWPGPLTILLPNPQQNSRLAPEVTAGLPTFGCRMPASALARTLIKLTDRPLAAPSANASTKPSPTAARHVLDDLEGRIELILDGGACAVGVESTVVDGLCDPPVVLRPGGVSLEELRTCPGWERVEKAYKDQAEVGSKHAPRAPGMKYKHYSPKARVVLYEAGEESERMGEGGLRTGLERAMGELPAVEEKKRTAAVIRTRHWPSVGKVASKEANGDSADNDNGFVVREGVLLGANGEDTIARLLEVDLGRDIKGVAHGLFAALRELDRHGADIIFVEGVSDGDDIAAAVMNRLRKAASEIRA